MANNKRRRPNGLGEIKVLIATLSITIMLSLWNIFSNQEHLEFLVASSSSANISGEEQLNSAGSPPLPPLPSLVSANQQELSGSIRQLRDVPLSALMGSHAPSKANKPIQIFPPSSAQNQVAIVDGNSNDDEQDQEQQQDQDSGSGIILMGGPEPQQPEPQDQQPSQPQEQVITTTGSS